MNPTYFATSSTRVLTLVAACLLGTATHAEEFNISIGTVVKDGSPAQGAGKLSTSTEVDIYRFTATAGQLVFFDGISAHPAFEGELHWEVTSPTESTVFNHYIDDQVGRKQLDESGTYQIRVYGSAPQEESHAGAYSFGIYAIPPDPTFAISVGNTVSKDQPRTGAGDIEVAGAKDIYTFFGTAGQALYFEEISSAAEFEGYLRWSVVSPTGQQVLLSWFGNTPTGRKELTETGTYRIEVAAGDDEPTHVGAYSFQIRDIAGDSRYSIALGQVVSPGVPGPGAGIIETAGGQDQFKFEGVAGQQVFFREISADAAFDGWLRWEVSPPSGGYLFGGWFGGTHNAEKPLPVTGTYTLRVYSGDQNSAHVGSYSFQVYSPVVARADNLATAPGWMLVVPSSRLLCNDTYDASNIVDVPNSLTTQGGTVAATAGTISYTPKSGFTGVDTFTYRLRGQFGGESTAPVTVQVFEGAETRATVVSLRRVGPTLVQTCLLGAASHSYRVEESSDLVNWTFLETITSGSAGEMTYDYQIGDPARRYFRFKY